MDFKMELTKSLFVLVNQRTKLDIAIASPEDFDKSIVDVRRVEMVKIQLENGADVNAKWNDSYLISKDLKDLFTGFESYTPLRIALTAAYIRHKKNLDNNLEITRLLLEYGAEPYSFLNYGIPPEYIALVNAATHVYKRKQCIFILF